jgi:hypothetical protein
MKYTTTLLKIASCAFFLTATVTVAAQDKKAPLNKLSLKAGQKFQTDNVVKTVTNMEMMGQQMEIKAEVTVNRQLDIKGKKDNMYNVASTVTRMITTADMMGQNMSYDSDKKEDTAGEMGKMFREKINVPTELEMNDEGKITPLKKQDNKAADDASGISAMMTSLGAGTDETILTDDVFHVMPGKIKTGDTWSDSIITEGLKTYRDYTIKSIQGNEATITISGKQLMDKKMENQGMEMTLVMESKLTGEMLVDTKSGVVKQRTLSSDGTGNMEMMGQELPITTKVDTTSTTKSL